MAEVNPSKNEEESIKNADDIPDNSNCAIRLIMYDFDQTITSLHLYRELHGGQLTALAKLSDDELITIFGGQERIEFLSKHFNHLRDSHIEIGIISFGWCQVIKTSLDRMHLGVHFENRSIFGRDTKEMVLLNRNKGKVMRNIIERKQLNYDQVLFVDDALSNIHKTNEFCKTLHVKARDGLSNEDMIAIEKQIYVYSEDEVQQILNEHENNKDFTPKKRSSKLDKYKIKSVPKWFEDLSKKEDKTPVIEIKEDTFSDLVAAHKNDVKIATKFTFGNEQNAQYPQ